MSKKRCASPHPMCALVEKVIFPVSPPKSSECIRRSKPMCKKSLKQSNFRGRRFPASPLFPY